MKSGNALRLVSFLIPLVACPAGAAQTITPAEISPQQKQELVRYLKAHWKTPEDYVAEKFSRYDIVFIGEFHRIKHDVELIHNLIPRLYKAGVRNLGIEFGAHEYQDRVDSLITADKYDEAQARWVLFQWMGLWGYVEYLDIYRKAWELNRSLPKGAPKFRVVNLGYRPNWSVLREERTPEIMKQVWHKGDPDEYMAEVILTEFVNKGQKALIYSGSHHAFTRYYQPIYDHQNNRFIRFTKTRMGNLVFGRAPEKVFQIFLHSPWQTKAKENEYTYPVRGTIDAVMKEFKEKRTGFDVQGSPFGKLQDPDTYYSAGYENFTLGDFCDGYIFQKHFRDYEGVTVDPGFVTSENLQQAVETLANPKARKFLTKPEDFLQGMREDADIKKWCRNLE